MTRRMYDAVTPGGIPVNAQLVAGYADGRYANLPAMHARFPHARVVSIAVNHTTRAQVADVETGDMSPATAVQWARDTMHDVPNTHLTIYANTSTWPKVKAAFKKAGVSLPLWWAAHYTGQPHLEPGSIATQYLNTSGYDESEVADYWPGVDPDPGSGVPATYKVRAGDTLSAIAARYGMDWHHLAALNHLPDPDLIKPGEILHLK